MNTPEGTHTEPDSTRATHPYDRPIARSKDMFLEMLALDVELNEEEYAANRRRIADLMLWEHQETNH